MCKETCTNTNPRPVELIQYKTLATRAGTAQMKQETLWKLDPILILQNGYSGLLIQHVNIEISQVLVIEQVTCCVMHSAGLH